MATEKRPYYYEGCVTQFGRVIAPKWKGTTFAVSAKKAKSNLAYRFKKEMGLVASCKIELPDKIQED